MEFVMATNDPETSASSDESDAREDSRNIWKRGFFMFAFAIFFYFAQTLLVIAAIIQFLSLLLTKKRNEAVSEFGKDLAIWFSKVALFQTMQTDEMPFPWSKWEKALKGPNHQ